MLAETDGPTLTNIAAEEKNFRGFGPFHSASGARGSIISHSVRNLAPLSLGLLGKIASSVSHET